MTSARSEGVLRLPAVTRSRDTRGRTRTGARNAGETRGQLASNVDFPMVRAWVTSSRGTSTLPRGQPAPARRRDVRRRRQSATGVAGPGRHPRRLPAAAELRARADQLASTFLDRGVTFDYAGEERPFPLDVVPADHRRGPVGAGRDGRGAARAGPGGLPRRRLRADAGRQGRGRPAPGSSRPPATSTARPSASSRPVACASTSPAASTSSATSTATSASWRTTSGCRAG